MKKKQKIRLINNIAFLLFLIEILISQINFVDYSKFCYFFRDINV